MKFRIFSTLILCLFMSNNVHSKNAIGFINSPDQLYIVSPRWIKKIKVIGPKAHNGNYKVELSNITNTKYFKAGYIYEKGWWSPSTQQLYTSGFSVMPNVRQCDHWTKSLWSFSFKPSVNTTSVQNILFYKETTSFHPKRKPIAQCINTRINRNTCRQLRCNEFKQPKPTRYITNSKKAAFEIYSKIRKN